MKKAKYISLLYVQKRGLKILLIKVKEESEEFGLKLYIKKTKTTTFNPITSCQRDGVKTETVTNFIFLGSKITEIVTEAMKLKHTCSLEGKL